MSLLGWQTTEKSVCVLTFEMICFILIIGEMPAEKQSKGRRDSLLPNWGRIIAIEYYRENDTLSKEEFVSVCILCTDAFSIP